jgi:hypothetical protein
MHSTRFGRLSLLALVAAMGLAACENDPSGLQSGFPALDAGLVAAQEAQGDVESMREPGVPGLRFPGLRLPSLDGDRPECPEDGSRFRCPPESQDGVTVTHEVVFLDGNGNAQEGFDDNTATVIFDMAMSATGMPPHGRPGRGFRGEDRAITPLSSEVGRERHLEAQVGEDIVTWNGSSASSSSHSFEIDGTTWDRSMEATSIIDDVVMPYPRTEDSWPLSGSITQHLVYSGAGPDGNRQGEVDATVTFDGSNIATVTVNGETMTIDLSERGRRGFGGHAR